MFDGCFYNISFLFMRLAKIEDFESFQSKKLLGQAIKIIYFHLKNISISSPDDFFMLEFRSSSI